MPFNPKFKKGDKVVMHSCAEASNEKYIGKIWICQTDSYIDKAGQEVVFLEGFSGCFLASFLAIVNITDLFVKAEFLFELHSKNQWINRVHSLLPEKSRQGEQLIFVDKDGYVFESGNDFQSAEYFDTYPCKVYRPFIVSDRENLTTNNKPTNN